jgi:hypothetical protein
MVRNITLEQYLVLKEKKNFNLFIFLLDNEYSYLNNEATWLHTLHMPVYLVRMNDEEFHMMDFGVHPKVLGTKKGKEILEVNGLPNINYLQYRLAQM